VLGWAVNAQLVSTLSELGVSLLLFTIGLEFSWRRLVQIGPIALLGGSVQVIVTTLLAGAVATACGASVRSSLAIGAMIAMSSTACVLRVLVDRGEVDSVHGRASLGILLLQDIAVVPLVLMVTMLAGAGDVGDMAFGLGKAVVLIVVLGVAFYVMTNVVLQRVFRNSALLRNRELLIRLALVLALGSAWAAHALKLSPALGAFVAGMLLAESPFAVQVRSDVASLRVLFVTLFFTAIGMLGDPRWIATHLPQVLGVLGLVVVGKALIVAVIGPMFRLKVRHAAAAGVSLAQVGEFSFVIAGVALGGRLVDEQTFRLFVSVTLVTLFLTPYLVAVSPRVGRWVERLVPAHMHRAAGPELSGGEPVKHADHVVIIGYGTAGQLVAEQLMRRNTPIVVVDLSHHNLELARQHHLHVQLGDATSEEVLRHAGIDGALAAVVALPDYRAVQAVIRLIRAHAPAVPIIVRARYHLWAEEIRRAGPDVVIDEERNIGRRLGRAVMRYVKQPRVD
jgi:CPA2 family monovalent cation:H+ antiporter-2